MPDSAWESPRYPRPPPRRPDRLRPCVASRRRAARCDARSPSDEAEAHAGLQRLFNEANLFGGAPAAAALNGGHDFNPRNRVIRSFGHSRIHRRMPMPYRLCRMSGQNGVHFMQDPENAVQNPPVSTGGTLRGSLGRRGSIALHSKSVSS